MEGTEQKTTFTAEEMEAVKQEALNKYKSDSAVGLEKLIEEKKFANSILDAVGEVAKDDTKLVDIFETNQDVANEILKKYYNGKTIEQYKESIGFKEDPALLNERLIESKAKSIVNESRIQDTKKAFIEKVGLEGDELESFNEEFEDRLQLRSFSIDKLDDSLTKSYKLATGYSAEKIKEIQKAKAIANAGSMTGGNKTSESERSKRNQGVRDFMSGRI